MATDVSATGRKLFRLVTLVFLGTGTMVVCLKHIGITDSDRERLKMAVNREYRRGLSLLMSFEALWC